MSDGTYNKNGTSGGENAAYRLDRTGGEVRLERTTSAGAERRRHRRVPWQHHHLDPMLLEVEEPGKEWREVPCTLVDLAAGGVGILLAEPLDPGSRVRVTFPLPENLEEVEDPSAVDAIQPWSAMAEVVHARHLPDPEHEHVPGDAHLPHHRGARFNDLGGDAEVRLMRALYGQLPAGWAVEQYRPRSSGGQEAGERRFAVVHEGKRVARGFTSYERARSRAMSMHMDDVAAARKRRAGGA
jgi:hypothetical protein